MRNPRINKETTCCFSGYRPSKLPWKEDETDRRCIALKIKLYDVIEALYEAGIRHFICGMARGADLYFAEAALALRETVPVKESVGRVLAAATVGCPPAVPIVVCGERIDEAAAVCLAYYGIESCEVVSEDPLRGKERSV